MTYQGDPYGLLLVIAVDLAYTFDGAAPVSVEPMEKGRCRRDAEDSDYAPDNDDVHPKIGFGTLTHTDQTRAGSRCSPNSVPSGV